jgi:hypothetical protein
MIYGDQGPFVHVTAVQGKKASNSTNANTTTCHQRRSQRRSAKASMGFFLPAYLMCRGQA